jgi:hypothetical protein
MRSDTKELIWAIIGLALAIILGVLIGTVFQ